MDNVIGFLTDAPFGTIEMGEQMNHLFSQRYYLVEQDDKQVFVIVTDDFIESRILNKKFKANKFEIGDLRFKKLKQL